MYGQNQIDHIQVIFRHDLNTLCSILRSCECIQLHMHMFFAYICMCECVRLYTFLFFYMFMYVYLCISAWLAPDSRGSTIREQWSPQSKANSLEDDCLLFCWHRKLDTVSGSLLPYFFSCTNMPIAQSYFLTVIAVIAETSVPKPMANHFVFTWRKNHQNIINVIIIIITDTKCTFPVK